MRGAGSVRLFGFLFAGALVPGCSREDEKPKTIDLTPGFARFATAPEGGPRSAPPPVKDEPWPGDVDASLPRPFQINLTRTVVREAGPAPANPDDAILERTRVAAGACYAALPDQARYGAPERSAHIVLTVIPTGTVSRAEVTSGDTTDEGVLDCMRRQALATSFSDTAGGPLRTYAIDVRVIAKGNGGGR